MKVSMTCPFCGGEHCVILDGDGYHCTSCEYNFTDDDIQHEEYRQKISGFCSRDYATEEKPIKCDIIIGHDGIGLSELEKPNVIGIFQDSEGIVWVFVYGVPEPVEADELTTDDLKTIYDYLMRT